MEWKNLPGGSDRIEDRRGSGGGGLAVGGIGGLILLLAAAFFGVDPRVLMNSGVVETQPQQTQTQQTQTQGQAGAGGYDELNDFLGRITTSTDQVWGDIFQRSGQQYAPPRFVRFSGSTQTGCGTGTSGMGPFYCPVDKTVYLDTSFFGEMQRSLGGGGDFAYSYVVAHEAGHHVQNELGISGQVQRQQQRSSKTQANALSVRLELQADCFAGVWGNHVADVTKLTEADVREAINTAAAIGDDTLQRQSRGYVQPDSFTHGSSEQRVSWFMRGLQSGDLNQCNTFDS